MKVILKENQIKGLMGNLRTLKEQNDGGFNPTTKTETINFSAVWQAGKYKLTQTQITSMKVELDKVVNFMKANPTAKLNITIQAGESQVTNYDREKCSNSTYTPECRLKPGDLSTFRSNELKTYLENYFKGLKQNGVIQTMPSDPKTETIIGKTKYTQNVDKPSDPKYVSEQFVKLLISAEATYDCLVGMNIKIAYDTTGHTCDEAIFAVKVNGVTLGIANLNNSTIDISTNIPRPFKIETYINNVNQRSGAKLTYDPKATITAEMGKSHPTLAKYVGKTMGQVATEVPEGDIKQKVKSIQGRETDNKSVGRRAQNFVLDTAKAQEIVSQASVKDRLVISLKPLVDKTGPYRVFYSKGSHSEVPSVYITGRNGDKRYAGTPNSKMVRGSMVETVILTTDLCGNPIKQ